MRTILAFIAAYPRRAAIMLLAMLLGGVAEGISLTTLLPILSVAVGNPTDSGLGAVVVAQLARFGLEPSLQVLLSVVVLGIVMKSLLLLIANNQVGYTVAHIATALRQELMDALLASRWEYFLRKPAGSLANSIATEAYRAATGFQYGALVITYSIQVIVYGVVALIVSWQATLAAFAAGSLFLWLLTRLVRASRRAGSNQTRLLRSLLSFLTDVLGSVKPLKAMARDNVADTILRDQIRQLERALRREVWTRETLRALQEPMLAILAAVGFYVAHVVWHLSLQSVMMLVFLLVRLLTELNKAQRQYQAMAAQESAYWALRRAAEEARQSAEHSAGQRVPTLDREIRLRGVDLGHGDRLIYRDLDLVFPAGSFTALDGPSGVGKTTLLDLLCGLVKPARGEVLVDGVPMDELDLRRWRRLIGYVPQDSILLHDTILNNVIVGESDLTREDAERALREAGAWEFVEAHPDGIHAVIGERGGLLSGGQRQRIAIARALAHRPRLLILDEPTSALDREGEKVICETLRRLAGHLTIIVASHQPGLIAAADRVYAIRPGGIVEQKRPAGAEA
jgi:ATP-binding cassette subfamily C protein